MKKLYTTIILLLIGVWAVNAQSPHAARLYGMTQYGGENHKGSIFHFTPETQTVTVDYEFEIIAKGKAPKCDIVSGNNGKYYGTTTEGGLHNQGVVFTWDSLTSEYKEVFNFSGADGSDARGGMVLYNSKLYGMTYSGGAHNFGVIYEYDILTQTYTKKIDLDSINGKYPVGSLTLEGNIFYGTTSLGGVNDKGILFTWNPSTNIYTKQYDFDSLNGSNPVGKLSEHNGKLYGMTNKGGTNDLGTIYEWNYTTAVYIKKHDFNGANGKFPMGSLALYNSKFYGMTSKGGTNQIHGIIFEWNPANNGFTQKKEFTNTFYAPFGSLVLKGNLFYGTTSSGTANGSIFTWNPSSNILTEKFENRRSPFVPGISCENYRVVPGTLPYCTFLLSGDKLLGTSSTGGGDNAGCIFEFSIDSNQITRSVHMLATNGKFPRGSLTRVGNKLFGFSTYGGENHGGNIFEWDMGTDVFTERFQFDGYNTSIAPRGTPTLLNGIFYGVNTYGKSNDGSNASYHNNRDYSEFFSWNPQTNQYQGHYNLVGQTSFPVSFSVLNNQLILPIQETYTNPITNAKSYTTILQFDPITNTVNDSIKILGNGVFVNHQNTNAESGNGLTYYNGKYYGMTPGEWNPLIGFTNMGTIYEWDTLMNHGIHRLDLVDSIAGTYPTGDLALVDSVFYGLTTGISSGGMYTNGGLFRWNPTTNVSERLNFTGGNGTPTYSEGKIYYIIGSLQQSLVEYDITNDTTIYYNLPDFPGPQMDYSWFSGNCAYNQYLKLLEVIPNELPILVSHPATQEVCAGQDSTAIFNISDADNDTLIFTINSSNEQLISSQGVSISNTGNVYTLSYSVTGQMGISTISIVADDGYGGSVTFSFEVVVNALPNPGINTQGTTLSAIENNATYQWIDCNNNKPISGAIAQSFTPDVNGEYAVIITNGNNCTVTSQCVSVTTLYINEPSLQAIFTLYPNPVSDELYIQTEGYIKSLVVLNQLGQKLIEQNGQMESINVSHLSSGLYVLCVEENGRTSHIKFIKQ